MEPPRLAGGERRTPRVRIQETRLDRVQVIPRQNVPSRRERNNHIIIQSPPPLPLQDQLPSDPEEEEEEEERAERGEEGRKGGETAAVSGPQKVMACSQYRTRSNDLYNFKGFMFLCFGTPGVAPNWCSGILFFYHVLLFTVGIGTVILGGISLALRDEMQHTKQFIFADILSILAGVLYLVAAFYGGCIWTWRTSFLPDSCTQSFLPLSILAWVLSLSHIGLVAAFLAVMINYGRDIIHYDLKFSLNLLTLWTLGGLVVWAVCFLIGLIPTAVLFRRKYKPSSTTEA